MGQQNKEISLFSYSVNLEKRVRHDHPLRKFHQVLDLSFVYNEVERFYGDRGNVSVDPIIIVKMMLLLFLDNIPSERELMKVIPERLDYLWFLGYSLDDEIPHHSVLSKARAKWGMEVFQKVFETTVLQCVEAGLVEGSKLHIDSSLIKANASKNSVITASPELISAIRQACNKEAGKLDEPIKEGVNATHLSTTDPDATLAHKPSSGTQLAYKSHRAIDDQEGVITAVVTTTGIASDSQQLRKLVEQHETNTQMRTETVVGDGHYGTAETYRFCQENGIRSHLRAVESHHKKISQNNFIYEEEADRYRCPQGNYLYYHNFKRESDMVQYKVRDAQMCKSCPLRSQCTDSERGRIIQVPIFGSLVRAGKEQSLSPGAQKDLKRRQYLMEGSFADSSNNHGFKRARWRRLWKQKIQDYMIAAVQNIRIMLARTGKGGPRMVNRQICHLQIAPKVILSPDFPEIFRRLAFFVQRHRGFSPEPAH